MSDLQEIAKTFEENITSGDFSTFKGFHQDTNGTINLNFSNNSFSCIMEPSGSPAQGFRMIGTIALQNDGSILLKPLYGKEGGSEYIDTSSEETKAISIIDDKIDFEGGIMTKVTK